MANSETKDKCQLVRVENHTKYLEFLNRNQPGLFMSSEIWGQQASKIMKPDAGDFAKWLREEAPNTKVEVEPTDQRVDLRSSDIWLPLIFIAKDVGLPMFLDLTCHYLYDKMKGALRGDRTRVHLSVIFTDAKSGLTKQFNFDGDSDALQKAIKRVDLEEFFDG